ncbi:MAG: Nif3-like dinuclear metal center hexameric protein [Planctomycetaceae bacterium]|nr:Nif3-like dinuclear metal center hexameric protein [Planctomycetaceae bacterium]
MTSIDDIATFLDSFAPRSLADDWDNVGLLVGDRQSPAHRLMTCLTLTPDVAAEAIEEKCDLVITHHPVLFRAVKRLTTDSVEGTTLLNLIRSGISVYSPHTGYDSAAGGINRQLAERLELTDIRPLRPAVGGMQAGTVEIDNAAGGGRYGALPAPMSLAAFLDHVRQKLGVAPLPYVGDLDMKLSQVAVACGSAAEFLSDAVRHDCQVLLTGEARFHACLEARSEGIALVLPGHYATERPALEHLATVLGAQFSEAAVWASRRECDPVQWIE